MLPNDYTIDVIKKFPVKNKMALFTDNFKSFTDSTRKNKDVKIYKITKEVIINNLSGFI